LGELTGAVGIDPTRLIDLRELDRLDMRIAVQLAALDIELTLQELVLRLHRDVLTGGHRDGARDETGESGEPHDPGAGIGAGDAEDQRDVRHQAVADAEHRGSSAAAANVTMMMLRTGGELRSFRATRVAVGCGHRS